jgi:tRNA(Ile)-lysidine synthase
LDTEYTRNKLRHEVLPRLEEAVDGASGNLARFAALAGEDDELLYALAKELLLETDEGYLVKFCEKKPLFRRASLLALKGLGLEKDYTALHLEQVFALQKLERGAKCTLPQNILAVKTCDGIEFYKDIAKARKEKAVPCPFAEKGFAGGEYRVRVCDEPVESGVWKVLKIDKDSLPKNAVFRFREEGDWMEKFGGGKKTLKKLFNEKKVPVEEREYLPLLAVGSEVYAVCGVEISEKLRVTESTEKTLYLVLEKA